jgi:hypothetical protein
LHAENAKEAQSIAKDTNHLSGRFLFVVLDFVDFARPRASSALSSSKVFNCENPLPFRSSAIACAVVAGLLTATPSAAQQWNDARVTELVSRATERRARQLADTGLTDYTATALGSLTFLAQVGEGFPDPPKVVKADQIALEVYWRTPNHSKQLIVGRRDTLLLPTDIEYHRDHLGIVQNNFPEIIRLGDGDEVRDVPHPLSAAGLRTYDYAISDSLRLEVPGQVIEVYEVKIRPKNDRAPAAVGAVYLSRADAQVVRMAFSFTRAALLDQQLEDVAIVLDNSLIEERFWLPRRQEIEIRRSGTWLDFPARGIIRGGFEVCCYRINQGTPPVRFTGPEIDLAPPARRAAYRFEEPLSAIVPHDLSTASSEQVARVQARAMELVSQAALARARSGALLARSVSDLVRFNRAEGLSLGAGVRRSLTPSIDLAMTGRYGFADERWKGAARLTHRLSPRRSLSIGWFDELRDASDVQETSGLRNSIAAQEFGTDFTEPYHVRGFDLRANYAVGSRLTLSIGVAREWHDSASLEATPARGTFRPLMAVPSEHIWRAEYGLTLTSSALLGGAVEGEVWGRVRTVEAPGGEHMVSRLTGRLQYGRAVGSGSVVTSTFAGIADSRLPPQDLIRGGGPVTAPGYAPHAFVSRMLVSQRVEWQLPVPFLPIPIGRWGHAPGRATFAPYAGILVQEEQDGAGNRSTVGYPSIGTGLLLFFDLIRLDVAKGIRNGRWSFGVDLTRDLWRIL